MLLLHLLLMTLFFEASSFVMLPMKHLKTALRVMKLIIIETPSQIDYSNYRSIVMQHVKEEELLRWLVRFFCRFFLFFLYISIHGCLGISPALSMAKLCSRSCTKRKALAWVRHNIRNTRWTKLDRRGSQCGSISICITPFQYYCRSCLTCTGWLVAAG